MSEKCLFHLKTYFQVIKNLEDFEVKRIKLDELEGKMIFRFYFNYSYLAFYNQRS